MPTLTLPPAPPSPSAHRKRWTVEEFHFLCGLPKFETRRMILVGGEILDTPNPNPAHNVGTGQLEEALRAAFGSGVWVRVQMALVLGQDTDPMPDLAVVAGPRQRYASAHPTTAVLVAEVAESSLAYDLGDKANLYATGGIADYWVLDLPNRQLHVFRDPTADPAEPFGFRYSTHLTLSATDSVAPLSAPHAAIAVADLLP
jgi:Uma2 family endonuclease